MNFWPDFSIRANESSLSSLYFYIPAPLQTPNLRRYYGAARHADHLTLMTSHCHKALLLLAPSHDTAVNEWKRLASRGIRDVWRVKGEQIWFIYVPIAWGEEHAQCAVQTKRDEYKGYLPKDIVTVVFCWAVDLSGYWISRQLSRLCNHFSDFNSILRTSLVLFGHRTSTHTLLTHPNSKTLHFQPYSRYSEWFQTNLA